MSPAIVPSANGVRLGVRSPLATLRRKSTGFLYLLQLPAAAAEERRARERERRKSNRDRDEHSARPEPDDSCQHVGERDLPQPEAEEVQPRRRPRVAGSVERLC